MPTQGKIKITAQSNAFDVASAPDELEQERGCELELEFDYENDYKRLYDDDNGKSEHDPEH